MEASVPRKPMLSLPELKVLFSFYEIVGVWSACGSDGTKPWKLMGKDAMSHPTGFPLSGNLNDVQMVL